MQSYIEADQLLTGRCKERRKIANNTWLERHDDEIAVRLHDTDIVTYRYDGGAISLNTGGWFTVTTKARMNKFSPFSISSVRGEWRVSLRNPDYVPHYTGDYRDNPYWLAQSVPFRDHMTFQGGRWYGIPTPDEITADRAERKKLYADIKRYVAGITPETIIRQWENTEGDCWPCKFGFPGGDDHLLFHVEEDYLPATMVFNMLTERGYNVNFAMSYIYSEAQRGVVDDNFLTTPLTKWLRKHLAVGVATVR